MSGNWQNKIFNHEETPPQGAWENIAKALDKVDNKVNTEIPAAKKQGKIIYWKFAAAASVAAIISIAIIWSNMDKKLTSQNSIVASVTTNKVVPQNIEQKTIATVIPEKTAIVVASDKKSNQPIDISSKLSYVASEPVKPLAVDPSSVKIEKLSNTSGDIPNDISLMNPPNSYVTFTGPNGQEIKVSSKFSNLLGYMDGKDPETQEYLDRIITESNFWRGKFKTWRNKMINNNLAPSPSNFMDIVELSNLLSEDN